MTPEEHLLVLSLHVKQAQFNKILLDILKSRGIVTADDVRAFEFAASVDVASNSALLQQVRERYLRLAKGLGVDLESPSPLADDLDSKV